MSQAIIAWGHSDLPPEEVYKNNKEYLRSEFDRVIKELKTLGSKLPEDILSAIVWEMKNLSENIVESYTESVFLSASHVQWVEDRMRRFNLIAMNMKYLIRSLEVELNYENGINNQLASPFLQLIPPDFNRLMDTIKAYISDSSQNSTSIKEDIEKLCSKIKVFYSGFEIEKILSQIEDADGYKLSLTYEELKLTYIKVKEQSLYREEIESLLKKLKHIGSEEASRLITIGRKLLTQNVINKSEYETFYREAFKVIMQDASKKPITIGHVLSKLCELGYTIIGDDAEIKEGKVIELRTPYGEDYILKVRVQDGKITTKFVRVLEEERELSTYEKERDVYTAKKWCGDFDTLLEKLKEEGINVEVKARVEPEERGIDYEVRKKEKRKSVREAKHGKPQQRKRTV